MSRWFAPQPVPPIEARAAAMGVPVEPLLTGRHCDACKHYRRAEELEQPRRDGVDLVICRSASACISAAKAAGLWKA